ncbi:MAG TPA: NUDIX hydrolase [Fervidicoccus fontis]|uniref:NUDIX hydrolase n=1 Tax=Fervidicoccus fontis TaxID=683846 RepID=A0A7C2UPV4_9CREN|nr:MAG: NUDIX hydrolase [Fervidicoccus sp.]HEU97387.1 NUDIX hydrolase [Fervidicoccus fontis]
MKFSGKRIKVFSGKVKSPDGTETYREIVRHPGAVVILAISGGSILLIKQYRHAIGKWIFELPAGTLEEGEDPGDAAERELAEETGYRAGAMKKLISFYSSPGISDEVLHLYLAEELEEGRPSREQGELIDNVWIPLEDALKMIEKNEIEDAKTIVSILYYATFLR